MSDTMAENDLDTTRRRIVESIDTAIELISKRHTSAAALAIIPVAMAITYLADVIRQSGSRDEKIEGARS